MNGSDPTCGKPWADHSAAGDCPQRAGAADPRPFRFVFHPLTLAAAGLLALVACFEGWLR